MVSYIPLGPGFLPVPESTGSRAGFIGSAQRWVRAWYLHGLESLSCLLLQRSPGDRRRKPGKRIEPKAIVLLERHPQLSLATRGEHRGSRSLVALFQYFLLAESDVNQLGKEQGSL